jgi:hypothetical protein
LKEGPHFEKRQNGQRKDREEALLQLNSQLNHNSKTFLKILIKLCLGIDRDHLICSKYLEPVTTQQGLDWFHIFL